jgi:hypothetical protein
MWSIVDQNIVNVVHDRNVDQQNALLLNLINKIINKKMLYLYIWLTPFIVIPAQPYCDTPGCTIHVDIYCTVPVFVTTVFLKMGLWVQNMYM